MRIKSKTVPCLATLLVAGRAVAAISTFDVDSQGWMAVSMPDNGPYDTLQGGPYSVTYEAASGNPGGAISMTDPDGVTWFFSAPSAYLGNQLSAHGSALSFDLKISFKSWTDADVSLYGAGLSLAVDAGPDPDVDVWTHYSVNLDTSGGWRVGTLAGVPATETQIQDVLADLQGLYIRGEFAFGPDYSLLDNVNMGGGALVVPEAGTWTMISVVGLLAFRSWRHRAAKCG